MLAGVMARSSAFLFFLFALLVLDEEPGRPSGAPERPAARLVVEEELVVPGLS
jgi:hypothetical protein